MVILHFILFVIIKVLSFLDARLCRNPPIPLTGLRCICPVRASQTYACSVLCKHGQNRIVDMILKSLLHAAICLNKHAVRGHASRPTPPPPPPYIHTHTHTHTVSRLCLGAPPPHVTARLLIEGGKKTKNKNKQKHQVLLYICCYFTP